MKKSTSRRMKPTFGYRGSTENHSNSYTFNRRPPFSRIKEIYGSELERFVTNSTIEKFEPNKLLVQQKKEIKERVLEQIRKEREQNILIICSMIFLVFLFLIFVNYYLMDIIHSYWESYFFE